MSNEIEKYQGEMPAFLAGVKPKGYEDVQNRTQVTAYRISQGQSQVVSEGTMSVGRLYDSQDKIDLGTERKIMIARKRITRQLMNPEGVSIACKGYNLDKSNHGMGKIRVGNIKDMPEEYLKAWGITPDAHKEERYLDFPCDRCVFADWKEDDDGKRIPPPCNLVHELFFFDVTDGMDSVPHIYNIAQTSKVARDIIKSLDNILLQKLQLKRTNASPEGLPIYGGVLSLKVDRAENSRKQKYFIPVFEFDRYLTNDDAAQFMLCAKFYEESVKQEAQYEEAEEVPEAKPDVESGNPWGSSTPSSEEIPWK